MKIYTKTGDQGDTRLFGGEKVRKNHPRVNAYGDIDEVNAIIGIVISSIPNVSLKDLSLHELLLSIQEELFILGADLATPLDIVIKTKRMPRIKESMVLALEEKIDSCQSELPPITRFILPGGSIAGGLLHLARTVSRRAERNVVALTETENINPVALKYLNRLSDFLFVLARYVNLQDGIKEKNPAFKDDEDI